MADDLPAAAPLPEPVAVPEPMSAVDRLRAFEDEKLGVDAPRIGGKLERGVGSLVSRMSDADRAHHTKLEKAVEAEAKLAAAHAALAAAIAEYKAAEAAANG